MKLMKRANIYQASNYNCTFDPNLIEARSYRWWAFVKVIKGQVIFNNYRYSNSTSKHQFKVRSLMSQLGIKIDRYVQVSGGLQHLTTLRDLNKAEKETLERLAAREEAKRIRRNERARLKRQEVRNRTRERLNPQPNLKLVVIA